MVKIKLFSPLSEKLGFKEKEISINKEIPVREIPELSSVDLNGYIILVNKRIASLDTKINDADEILILPYVEGG